MKKILLCGQLFDATKTSVGSNMAIVVEDNKIIQVAPAAEVKTDGAQVIDLSDKFVMPGLIDTHVHVYFDGLVDGFAPFLYQHHGEILIDAMLRAQRDLLAGFTSLRDCGCGKFGTDLSLRKAINDGRIAGPRLCVSGGMIVTSAMQNIYTDGAYTVEGPDQARAAARDTLGKGCDQVKLMVTVGVLSNGDALGASVMTYEEIRAACEVAQELGALTSAHAHGVKGIIDASRAGITSIEHGILLNDEAAGVMAENGTYLVPTLASGHFMLQSSDMLPPHVLEKERMAVKLHQQALTCAYNKGVKIAFGTDTGTPGSKHGKQGVEFALMNECGIPAAETLLMATRYAAEMMKWDNRVGTIESGKLADIVAFDKNPLDDLSVMTDCSFVMKDGTVYKGECAEALTLG